MNERLLECLKIVAGAVPIDTNGAGVTGDYVSLKKYRRLMIVIKQGAWAGGTPAVTLKQATTAAGGSEKALAFTEYWQGTALTDDTYARTAVVANTFNLPATANTVTVIEIFAGDLDQANDFAYARVAIASPGANADLIDVTYVLGDSSYSCVPSSHPSAID